MSQNLSKDEFIALQSLSKNKDLIIQKPVIGDSVVIVDRPDMKEMDKILRDQRKFAKVNLKDDTTLNFAVNQEKRVDKVLKKLIESNSMKEKPRFPDFFRGSLDVDFQFTNITLGTFNYYVITK